MTRAVTAASVRRKLHAWELLHLREWAAQLEAENEQLREQLRYTEDVAASWRDDVMRLQEEGMQLGLTQDGHIVQVAP